jgi:hypothetical protein
MQAKKNCFDWSALDRNGLTNDFMEIKPLVIQKNIKASALHALISKHIKSKYPIRVRKIYNQKIVEPGTMYLLGLYYSDLDKGKKKCIEIQFAYNNPKDSIFLDTSRLKKTGMCFADTVLHEVIHMRQFRRRKFKYLPEYASNAEKTEQRQEQNYLGSSDEIDAYGFNIACELNEKFRSDIKKIVKYLDENQKNKKRNHSCWRMYLHAFDHDHSHAIIKRLKKKIIRYLPHAIDGKPYRNKDWINR